MYRPSPPPRRSRRRFDYTNSLPDECLALIFTFLTTTSDRNSSSLVSRRWLRIEAQTRTHLTLNADSNVRPFIPSIFTRFNSLTHLVLRNGSNSPSINDNDMILITSMCPNLTRLKLSDCEQLTDSGMAVFTKNCKNLKEFSCDACSRFSDLGMFELLDNCSQLEVLSVKRAFYVGARVKFHAGAAVNTIKVIKLRSVYNYRLFAPLISCCKNLKTLKMINCLEKMGRVLEMIPDDNCLAEVYLYNVKLSDVGVSLLAKKCRDLIAFHIQNTCCTEVGLISIAENCKGLKKLYVGHYLYMDDYEIGDEALIALGKHCVNLEELVLIGVKPTYVGLDVIATNCQNLVSLELCSSDTITDVEMMCIVEKCVALKSLCIEECDVSNNGIEALGLGCPNLVNLEVILCRKVTPEVGDLLREKRGSLAVKVDDYKSKVVYPITLKLVSTRFRL